MAAERNPPTDYSLLARPVAFLVDLTLCRPKAVLVLSTVLAVAATVLASQRLGFHSSRADLLDPREHYNQLWLRYVDQFGDADDTVVVVEGSGPAAVTPVLDEVAGRLAGDGRLFHAVLRGVDLTKIRGKGLHYLPIVELAKIDGFLQQAQPVVAGQWSQLNLGQQAARAGQLAAHPEALQDPQLQAVLQEMQSQLPQLIGGLHSALVENKPYQSPWPDLAGPLAALREGAGSEYLLANEGRLGFVVLHISGDENQLARGSEAIDNLRHILADIRSRHPEVSIGLTGLPVMENDEMRASTFDMNLANAISLAAVGALFYAGFGGLRHSLLGVAALLFGMAWSMGFATLAVGHLNILSAAFGVVLIGLGINFPIHFASCYIELRPQCENTRAALLGAARMVGPGIVTGGATIALSFFATAMTHFKGVVELGIISGGGIVLCIAAALFVLPPLLFLSDRNRPPARLPHILPLAGTLAFTYRYPRTVVLGVLAIAGVAALGLSNLRYDHNLLNLQPRGLESVELEHKLLAESDKSSWYAISLAATPADALARKEKFLALPSVERVEEIASLVPVADPSKEALIAQIGKRLERLPDQVQLIPVDPPEQMAQEIAALEGLLLAGNNESRTRREQLEHVREALHKLPPDECLRRVSGYQQALATDLLTRLKLLKSLSNPEPPTLADLPPGLVTRFVGRNQAQLLRIYARGSIWDHDALTRFVREVSQVDPDVTGNPIQAYYASGQMQIGYFHAGLYSLIIVAITVMLDFRSLRCLLLSLVTLVLGMAETFGILGWLNIPLNPANLIALPLIIGIGIDSSVLLIQDYLQQRGNYRLSNSRLNSIMLAALTTTGSFGALLFSSHHGLRTQGQVLSIGVSCCFVTAVVLLPAAFTWMDRRRDPGAAATAPLPHAARMVRRAAARGMRPERVEAAGARELEARRN